MSGPPFHVTVTFAEHGGKTKLTMQMLFESAKLRDKVIQEFNAAEGLNQTLACLADQLAKLDVGALPAPRSGNDR